MKHIFCIHIFPIWIYNEIYLYICGMHTMPHYFYTGIQLFLLLSWSWKSSSDEAPTSFLYVTFSKLKRFYLLENVFFFRLMYTVSNVHAPPPFFVFFGHAFNIKLTCLLFILNCKWIYLHVNKNDSSWCWRTLYISSIIVTCSVVLSK